MRDALDLRRKLMIALACTPFYAPVAMADEPSPVPVLVPAPPMPEPRPMPTCPSGEALMTQQSARDQAAEYVREGGAVSVNGDVSCPESFSTQSSLRQNAPVHRPNTWMNLNVEATKTARAKEGGDATACVYQWVIPCPGGRVLIDGDAHLVAETRPGSRWSKAVSSLEEVDAALGALPDGLRAQIANAWLGDARIEHASVASFARATLELMQLGAPPSLVADAQLAGVDEVLHAQGCFAMAGRYGGQSLEAGPLEVPPLRPATLARLAVDTLTEGCVGESIATLATTRALRRCGVAPVRALLERIIEDETTHAALGWATVRWALEEGGEPVREALIEAAMRMRAEAESAAVEAPLDANARDLLAFHGRLDAAAQREAQKDAWAHVIWPMFEALCLT